MLLPVGDIDNNALLCPINNFDAADPEGRKLTDEKPRYSILPVAMLTHPQDGRPLPGFAVPPPVTCYDTLTSLPAHLP